MQGEGSFLGTFADLAKLKIAVPVNLKDHDAFHLTIEEYLQALISLVDELVSPFFLYPRMSHHSYTESVEIQS